MQKLFSIIKEQKYFLIPFIFAFILSIFLLINYSKTELHIAVNQKYNSFLDTIFYYITYLGDGLISVTIGLLLMFYSFRSSLIVLLTYVGSGIFVQLLKKGVFFGSPRPKAFFEGIYDLRFIEGLEVHTRNSFPSGHAAAAFALFFSLALLTKNKFLQFIFLIFAILTSFSRVYLSQHFQIDITVGAIIGIVFVLGYYFWQSQWKAGWLDIPVYKLKEYRRNLKSDIIEEKQRA